MPENRKESEKRNLLESVSSPSPKPLRRTRLCSLSKRSLGRQHWLLPTLLSLPNRR